MDFPAFDWSRTTRTDDAALPMAVATFYCTVPAAEKAAALVDRLKKQFSGDFDIENSLWSFDVLQLNAVAEFAVSCASKTDVLVVAAGAEDSLPPHVVKCLEAAVSRRQGRNLAVVALVDRSNFGRAQICSALKRLCCTTQGDTFFCACESSDDSELTPERVNARAKASSTVLDSIMKMPVARDPYWRSI